MTKRERRVFTEEFKRESVRLIETSGRTITQIGVHLHKGTESTTGLPGLLQSEVPVNLHRLGRKNRRSPRLATGGSKTSSSAVIISTSPTN